MLRRSLLALTLGFGLARAEPRQDLADQLAQQQQTIDSALATVNAKLTAADALRTRRLRAAYRLLHASAPDPMLEARRIAAARLLLARDAAERDLLAHEAANLAAARVTVVAATQALASITLPTELARPVSGKIARRFGTIEHEKSHATLSRHGVDFEVEPGAPVSAPADGVVRYAGPIRGLDHGVILDHGGYLTIVAKLADPALPVGTHLARGDRLGQATRHRVYLEVRIEVGPGGLPIDPEPLLH